MSLQTIVSRNIDPQDATVVTVGFFKAGSAYNVIPGEVHIGGTTRTTTPENRALAQRRIKEICDGAAQMYGVKIEVEHRPGYPPTVNNAEQTEVRPRHRRRPSAASMACATTSSRAWARRTSPTCSRRCRAPW